MRPTGVDGGERQENPSWAVAWGRSEGVLLWPLLLLDHPFGAPNKILMFLTKKNMHTKWLQIVKIYLSYICGPTMLYTDWEYIWWKPNYNDNSVKTVFGSFKKFSKKDIALRGWCSISVGNFKLKHQFIHGVWKTHTSSTINSDDYCLVVFELWFLHFFYICKT